MATKIMDIVSQADCFITDGESRVAGLKILREKKYFEVLFIGGKRHLACAKKNSEKDNKKISTVNSERFDLFIGVGKEVREDELCKYYFGMTKQQFDNTIKKTIAKCDCLIVGKEKYAVGLRYNVRSMDCPIIACRYFDMSETKRFAKEVGVIVVESNPVSR